MNDNNNENGRSYLDDVEEKGYLGLMLAFFRQCTKAEEWPARREALLKVFSERFFAGVDADLRLIGHAVASTSSIDEYAALNRYFGLLSDPPMNVSATTSAFNEAYRNHLSFNDEEVGRMIGEGLRSLGDDPDFREYASGIVADAEKYLAA